MKYVTVLLAMATAAAGASQPTPEQVLQQSRDKYAAMTSYSDTGSITTSYKSGPAAADVETHSFRTYYQSPRQFYLEFRKDAQAGNERFVIWSEGQDFNTWWSATQVHEDYPKGSGATAFAVGSMPTHGAAVMIPPLLFSKAGLQGPLANLIGLNVIGMRRRGFAKADIHRYREAFRALFFGEGEFRARLERVAADYGGDAQVKKMIDFIRAGKRPLTMGGKRGEAGVSEGDV